MKKTLSAILVLTLSILGASALASTVELKLMKVKIESEDGTQPGGNRVSPNGLKKSKGGDM